MVIDKYFLRKTYRRLDNVITIFIIVFYQEMA